MPHTALEFSDNWCFPGMQSAWYSDGAYYFFHFSTDDSIERHLPNTVPPLLSKPLGTLDPYPDDRDFV